ncbi:MAG: transporter substrate-binding domain-containing protein [Anaerolineaceae bacterium]|nr:transporter substrate-binding domain-containing protein [Anaerolineaceae bacterium]
MKKFVISILMIAVLALSAAQVMAQDAAPVKIGALSMLNLTEEQYAAISNSRLLAYNYLMDQGVLQAAAPVPSEIPAFKIEYYDTLDAMLMSLQSGSIQMFFIPQTTGEYLCANNDRLFMPYTIDYDKADRLIYQDLIRRSGSGYSFMMLEDQTELQEQFNNTITAMEQDGTLETLQQKYINDVISGSAIEAIEFEKFDGDPIRVAVTGSLPPMDYVAPDGTFAGFNTALLSEIGKRLERNIELVQVDSLGRAAALVSGKVDVVFWTQTTPFSWMSVEERMANAIERAAERDANFTEEEKELWQAITVARGISRDNDANQDMPEGTIVTKQYLQDAIIFVMLKAE